MLLVSVEHLSIIILFIQLIQLDNNRSIIALFPQLGRSRRVYSNMTGIVKSQKLDNAWREPLPLDLRGDWKSCVACSVVHSSLHSSSHVRCIRPFSFSVQSCTMYILRSTRSFPGLAMTLAWAGGIFIRYHIEDTYYTLVDLYH